jgi:hypothetical protein
MRPLSEANGADGPAISHGATLEEALRTMTDCGARTAKILDEHARPKGCLTMDAVVSAMVTPVASENEAA